jgi:hypothetical protein
VKYVYGKEGKPYYMRGPHESMNDAKNIIEKLGKNVVSPDLIMWS